MPHAEILRIYLEPATLRMAKDGAFGFVSKVHAAFESRGFAVELVEDSDAARLGSALKDGYALFLMKDPFHARSLSMRRAYYYPYWRIEATAKRWMFKVAERSFIPAETDPDLARDWFNRWRRFLFKKAALNTRKDGLIYVPLQGRLLEHRSFQTISPVQMIEEVRARAGDRRILLGLHPGESYSDAERAALERLEGADPRIAVQLGEMEKALRVCDFVVTENSAVALSGLFFRKPAILFGKSDFHHVMAQVSKLGVDEAWRAVEQANPPVARYLYWFIHQNSIKADTDDAPARIIEACRSHGWLV